ncbi:sensor histidine kinase [Sulfoacidibacillus thermotolerans]|uniref:histidine kinase n=1 Tax=Sulfoacidibacillus thermotolerans TaxID=1765684 RepID=A0A2U3D191_SULT2|nr:HAMP domain-containing sensor histidine kinase [Sulfoacidibacillus thermotolerans]PWI55038.1 hypothetical protein BM613_13480 [Sulfoacidibacillus thermotolerans]
MSKMTAPSEKQLLARTQHQLIAWFFLALLAFAMLLLGGIYYALRSNLLDTAYQEIEHEWEQKTPEAIHKLQDTSSGETPTINIDSSPEDVATWVFTTSGHVVQADYSLIGVPGSLRPLFLKEISQKSNDLTYTQWIRTSFNKSRILLGIHPLFINGRRVGTIMSAYSITAMTNTLQVLMWVDIELGIASIFVILLITYVLAQRTLQPIRSALQRQRHFVNDASHELRTPLTILRGNLELAKMEATHPELNETLTQCISELDYLTHVVTDLSMLARSDSTQLIRNPKRINVDELVTTCIQDLQPLAKQKNISLSYIKPQSSLTIFGDAAQLRQLMIILVENAIKYNLENGKVQVSLEQKTDSVDIMIADTGIGIPANDLPYVFDRFYRSEQARHQQIGSGIGLAIAAGIVESHRGQIGVTSQVGQGTTFTVTLSLADHIQEAKNK